MHMPHVHARTQRARLYPRTRKTRTITITCPFVAPCISFPRGKMHLLTGDYESVLLEHISACQLEEKYGGTRTEPYPIMPPPEDAEQGS